MHKRIDTCAAEFVAPTPYMYSTYERPFAGAMRSEAGVDDRAKVVILGGGPNRIGQGDRVRLLLLPTPPSRWPMPASSR